MADDMTDSSGNGVEPRRQVDPMTMIDRLEAQLAELKAALAPPPKQSQKRQAPVRPTVVKGIIRARRVRDSIFDDELFADPAWDIFLELYAAELLEVRVATSQLCRAAAVPLTTALRWIEKLEDLGWIKREADPEDGRRIFVELAERGSEAMRKYFSAAGLSELQNSSLLKPNEAQLDAAALSED